MKKIETLRHSYAHILAAAVQELFPGTKFGIGPVIENGFYYDFDLRCSLTPEDLPKIEKKMKEIIKKDISFKKQKISKKKAKEIFENQPYKLELINELTEKQATVYESGNFVDLCRGPHIKSTKEINPDAFKLTKIAGAYWRGDEKNPMLTRIYGVAFRVKKELDDYLKKQKEAEKRDHRKLGRDLELFIIPPEAGAGLVLWLPKGAILRETIETFWKNEHLKKGYTFLVTPHIYSSELWKISGHYEWYKDGMMFTEIEGQEYGIKPMNCNGHVLIYKSKIRSYKDLPLRYAELGTVYRAEKSGVLHGIMRPRGFTQDDAHIICTQQQMLDELCQVVDLVFYMYDIFGFKNYHVELSTRPKKSIGSDEIWRKSTAALKKALETKKIKYQLNPGDGAFYGPKIDFHVKDAIGRSWQCGTIQLDFNLPERFQMNYIDEKGKKQQPIMIHRTILGSLERFIGVLLEHYAGALPIWLSPVQAWIIPIASRHKKYADKVSQQLKVHNLRLEIKSENETVSKKIREGELQKIPYLLVVGDKEEKSNTVRVRDRQKGDIGMMKIEKFIKKIQQEIAKKR
jgi:threonyl-tRNA synthetase